tara:strand:- start:2456 stop:3832 length:1377 start_codon:yes stop_codon:yes gene_type:complete
MSRAQLYNRLPAPKSKSEGFWEAYEAAEDRDERREDKAIQQANIDTARQDSLQQRQDSLQQQSILNQRYAKAELDREAQTKRDDWNIMYEGVTDPADKETIIKAGIDDNVRNVDLSLLEVATNARIRSDNIKTNLTNYYNSDDMEKLNLSPKLISTLTQSGTPVHLEIAAKIEKNTKDLQNRADNKEIVNMMVSSYPNVFKDQLKTHLESSSSFSDKNIDMVQSMLEQNMKAANLSSKQKSELASKLMLIQTKGDMPTQEQRNAVERAHALGFRLNQELGIFPGTRPPDEKIDFPTLKSIDDNTTGKKGTFDAMSDERKSSEFKRTLEKVIPGGQKTWEKMESNEQREKGQEIINIINEKSYTQPPKVSMFGGSGDITDPDYKGEESITDEEVNERYELILKKKGIVGKRRKMSTKRTLDSAKKQAREELEREMMKKSKLKLNKIRAESFYDPDIGGA